MSIFVAPVNHFIPLFLETNYPITQHCDFVAQVILELILGESLLRELSSDFREGLLASRQLSILLGNLQFKLCLLFL